MAINNHDKGEKIIEEREVVIIIILLAVQLQ